MKVAVVSDIHGNAENVRKLVGYLKEKEVEAVFILGDFTDTGHLGTVREILDLLQGFRVFAIPGNMDSKEIVGELEGRGLSLHKKVVELGGWSFVGLGGAKPVNTYYRFNLGELEAKKYLGKLFGKVKGKVVLVMHSPPKGMKISRTASGVDLGIEASRKFIEEKQPEFCFCGHVHESYGEEKIGKTRCVNVGPLKEGFFVLADLETGKIEWIDLNE